LKSPLARKSSSHWWPRTLLSLLGHAPAVCKALPIGTQSYVPENRDAPLNCVPPRAASSKPEERNSRQSSFRKLRPRTMRYRADSSVRVVRDRVWARRGWTAFRQPVRGDKRHGFSYWGRLDLGSRTHQSRVWPRLCHPSTGFQSRSVSHTLGLLASKSGPLVRCARPAIRSCKVRRLIGHKFSGDGRGNDRLHTRALNRQRTLVGPTAMLLKMLLTACSFDHFASAALSESVCGVRLEDVPARPLKRLVSKSSHLLTTGSMNSLRRWCDDAWCYSAPAGRMNPGACWGTLPQRPWKLSLTDLPASELPALWGRKQLSGAGRRRSFSFVMSAGAGGGRKTRSVN